MNDLGKSCPEFALARDAASRAGAILMQHRFEGVQVLEKAESDLVSDADVEAEQAILSFIRTSFPDHSILAEESQAESLCENIPEHLWIVDPLDGTTNFLHGIPHFAVSIAYYRNAHPVCGVVYNPAREDWFVAVHGEGAYHNDRRLSVGPQTSLSESLVGLGFYYDRGAMMEATLATIHKLFKTGIHGVRRFGTASLDLAAVACGQHAAYFEYQLSPWDFAAGRLLVEEAGGRVTTATGDELPFKKTSVLASNQHLHETMLAIISETAGHLFSKNP